MREVYRRTLAVLAFPALVGGAAPAGAAAFQLQGQSASLLGSAFAGRTADAYDIGHMFFNPAALGWRAGAGGEAEVVATYIKPDFAYSTRDNPDGLPGAASAASTEDAVVPVAYAGADVGRGLRVGVGINAPYGSSTRYDDDWIGRYDATETDLVTIDVNPALGWRVNDRLALGVGVSAQYAEAALASMVPTDLTPENDRELRVEGDDWSYGFNAGAVYRIGGASRVGVSYRRGMSHDLSGDAEFDGDSVGAGAELNIPATLSLGISHRLTGRWVVLADATWTQWSDFEEVAIELDEPLGSFGDALPPDEHNWDDAWFFSLGARYDHSARWTFRAGATVDRTPTSDDNRTPRIPDEDRYWVAAGATWRPAVAERLRLDFGYAYIRVADTSITLAEGLVANPQVPMDHPVTGEYDSDIHMASVAANWRF